MSESHVNSRLEAFCDGVFAIALTLLIIDIKIPATAFINSTSQFWLALKHILPSILTFLLSFTIIFITWVNHHNNLKLVDKSSPAFIYSNGLMLLTVVLFPFPTSLMGEYVLSDHAAPSVILYETTLALQAFSWILVTQTALRSGLCKSEKAIFVTRTNNKFSYFALFLYSTCAILAIWFPVTIAILTTISWIFWLVYGITIR